MWSVEYSPQIPETWHPHTFCFLLNQKKGKMVTVPIELNFANAFEITKQLSFQ
jgi:hypothetical protein